MKTIWLFTLSLGLAGCANLPGPSLSAAPIKACIEPSQEQSLALNVAQELTNQGRLHAALAHLQTLSPSLVQARLEQAKLMRTLQLAEAKPLYESLLNTCLAADGHHGLGQLAAANGSMEKALLQLKKARDLAPTQAKIRNDLGVAYLGNGQQDLARFEFLTALELDQHDKQPALNLLALLFYQERLQQAEKMAHRMKFSAVQVREAQSLAQRLRQGQLASTVQSEQEGT